MKLTKQFVRRLIKKDRRTQNIFYKDCFSFLMNIATRYYKDENEAAMIVNQAFMKILTNISKFDIDKDIEPWLKQITVNCAIDNYRKNYKHNELTYDIDNTNLDLVNQTEHNNYIAKANAEELLTIINKLPDATKNVFNLHVIDGYKHKEISDMLGITTETSKWHVKEARKRLRTMFEELNKADSVTRKVN